MYLSQRRRWRRLCTTRSTHAREHDTKNSWPPETGEHAPAGLTRAALGTLGAGSGEASEDGSDGSEEDSQRSSRSVSFDETARVMLVPTRLELLAIGRGTAADGDAPRGEGLWWTRKECSRFRRTFRRQIFAQGLQKSCTTLLMKDQMVYAIGRDDEEEGDDAGVGAGGGGRSGACSSSDGGAELTPSPSPILAAVVQDVF